MESARVGTGRSAGSRQEKPSPRRKPGVFVDYGSPRPKRIGLTTSTDAALGQNETQPHVLHAALVAQSWLCSPSSVLGGSSSLTDGPRGFDRRLAHVDCQVRRHAGADEPEVAVAAIFDLGPHLVFGAVVG